MLKGYKTYITGVMTILTAIAAYLVGEAEIGTTIQLVVTAVMGMTIRAGVSTEAAKKLVIGALCVMTMAMFQPRQAHADPFFLFAITTITGGWAGQTNEECKVDGLDVEDCVKRTWAEREAYDAGSLKLSHTGNFGND